MGMVYFGDEKIIPIECFRNAAHFRVECMTIHELDEAIDYAFSMGNPVIELNGHFVWETPDKLLADSRSVVCSLFSVDRVLNSIFSDESCPQ